MRLQAILVAGALAALPARIGHAADPVRIGAQPSTLRLGTDKSAQVVVELPASATDLKLTANLGRIENVARTGEGRFVARYVPPEWTYPQVAILSAVARTPSGALLHGWTRLPLFGQGDAVVRAKPGAQIRVRIGEQTFGPVTANRSGVALVPVVVPPGVKVAQYGTEPVDLGVPETTRLHLAVGGPPLRADQPSALEVLVFAVTPDGAVRAGPHPRVKASRGALGPVAVEAPGVYRTRWTAHAGKAGSVELVATLEGEEEPARLRFELPPGPPSRVSLSVKPDVVAAGQTHELTAVVTMADRLGNPTSPEVELEPSALRVVRDETPAPGRRKLTFTVDPNFGGRDALEVRVRPKGSSLAATAKLALRPGPLSKLRFTAPSLLISDGQLIEVSVRAEDAFGNGVAVAAPKVEAHPGNVERIEARGRGEFAVHYRPPQTETPPATVAFRAKVAALSESLTVDLAQPGGTLVAGVKAGLLSNAADVATVPVAVDALWRRWPVRGLAAGVELSWFGFGPDRAPLEGFNQYYSLAAAVLYEHPVARALAAEGRLGAGVGYVRSRLGGPQQPMVVEHAWVPLAHVAVGLVRSFGRDAVTAELRYGFHGDPRLGNLRGRLHSGQLLVGYRFGLR